MTMDIYKRELEKKYTLTGITYEEAHTALDSMFTTTAKPQVSLDKYWKAPSVDFVRLRANSKELTVKVSDKGGVIDRIEENVVLAANNLSAAERLMTLLLGPSNLKLTKKFSVYTTTVSPAPGTSFDVDLCLYQVEEDSRKRIFFEVEAESLAVVDYTLDKIEGLFKMAQENRSLYQIFIKGDK